MGETKRTGRIVGILLFPQLAGLIVPFVLLLPLTKGPQAYLANAVGASSPVLMAVCLLFANCALTICISIAVFRTFRERSESMALWLLAVSAILFTLQAVDNIHVLSMLSLSRQYAEAGHPDGSFQILAAAIGSMRRWAHLAGISAIDWWIFLLYANLFRFALVPRALAVLGLTTVVLHFAGIPLRGFLNLSPVTLMGVPMGLSHLVLAAWLAIRGFDDRHHPTHAEAIH